MAIDEVHEEELNHEASSSDEIVEQSGPPKVPVRKKSTIPWKYILGGLALIMIITGVFLYSKYEPSRHFKTANIPVLATPQVDAQGLEHPDTKDPDEAVAHSGDTTFNVLLLGIDARADEDSRTDMIMLAHVNVEKNIINLVSIPRDTRVNIQNVGLTKINHAHILGQAKGGGNEGGTKATLQAVSDFCQCTINYYMKTNFEGFEHFIDTIGGIDIELDESVKLTYAHTTIEAGEQHLNGEMALKFVQERKSLSEGDNSRQANQAKVLNSIIHKLLEPQNLSRIPSLVNQVREDIVDTNLSDDDIVSLVWLGKAMTGDNIQYFQVPGTNAKAHDPLVGKELYYWIPNLEEWSEIAKEYLH